MQLILLAVVVVLLLFGVGLLSVSKNRTAAQERLERRRRGRG